jgi:hypothetical protein
MRAARPSPFDALEATFQLLTSEPAPLAINGHRLGHGLPARLISLRELGVLLVHPSVTAAPQRVVLDELVHRATQDGGGWVVGLAGVLLPGFRAVAARTHPISAAAAFEVEADLLERYHVALTGPRPAVTQLAPSVLELVRAADGRVLTTNAPSWTAI